MAAVSLISLIQLWYADNPLSSFKTINGSNEWLQMDKFGHVFMSYQFGRLIANILNWAGVRDKDQLVYGSTLGL